MIQTSDDLRAAIRDHGNGDPDPASVAEKVLASLTDAEAHVIARLALPDYARHVLTRARATAPATFEDATGQRVASRRQAATWDWVAAELARSVRGADDWTTLGQCTAADLTTRPAAGTPTPCTTSNADAAGRRGSRRRSARRGRPATSWPCRCGSSPRPSSAICGGRLDGCTAPMSRRPRHPGGGHTPLDAHWCGAALPGPTWRGRAFTARPSKPPTCTNTGPGRACIRACRCTHSARAVTRS